MHECMFCNKAYKRIGNYSKHIVICEQIHSQEFKKKPYKEEEPLSLSELTTMVKFLLKENTNLKKKVCCLEAHIKRKRKKTFICNWLNDKFKEYKNSMETIESYIIDETHLNYILDSNYVNGYAKIFMDIYTNSDSIAMKAFSEKANKIYVKIENNWVFASQEVFSDLLFCIKKKICKRFHEWSVENDDKIQEDPKLYFDNNTKVLGDPNHIETKNKRIYSIIYEKIAQPLVGEEMTIITF